jgi:hypothetical protein
MFGPIRGPAGTSLRSDRASSDSPGRLALLASAISHRDLQVAPGEPGQPAWTDGRVVFVDAEASAQEQVRALAVQASLLAAGSLDRDVVRGLARRPALARRYLAVEGHRALAAIEELLPRTLRSLVDPDVAARVDSPAASLAVARSREAIADPPESFGSIRARALLATPGRAGAPATTREPIPLARHGQVLAELGSEEDAAATDAFASPVGGGGALGRLLGRLLREVRQLGGGPPGADAPTHRGRDGRRSGRSAVLSAAPTGTADGPAVGERGTKYPEWDVHGRRYRADWCTVHEVEPRPMRGEPLVVPQGYGLRRPLARLGMGLDSCHRQPQGDDVDIDAAIEARIQGMAGSATDEAVYLDSLRRRRDLSVLLLLDISGSTAEPAASGRTVHEEQREVAAALTVALHQIGDRVALHAFHSQGRSAVRLMPVKRFGDALDPLVLRRLRSLVPGGYSRLGAAIRHGSALLRDRGATSRRLLVVLSDGLAYDHGYEPAYGAADARRALAEARSQGIGCLCLSIGASTDAGALRHVFGSAAHATLPRPDPLGRVIGPLFRSALRSAEVRRRVSP